ncbi:hypothetical protein ACLOJK_032074 [Asimina triloba]
MGLMDRLLIFMGMLISKRSLPLFHYNENAYSSTNDNPSNSIHNCYFYPCYSNWNFLLSIVLYNSNSVRGIVKMEDFFGVSPLLSHRKATCSSAATEIGDNGCNPNFRGKATPERCLVGCSWRSDREGAANPSCYLHGDRDSNHRDDGGFDRNNSRVSSRDVIRESDIGVNLGYNLSVDLGRDRSAEIVA